MKINVLITTFERPESLTKLLDQIVSYKDKYELNVVVWDDSIKKPFSYKNGFVKIVHNKENRGKKKFWITWNEMFKYCKEHRADFYYFLQDDFLLTDNFFDDTISLWGTLRKAVTLSPLTVDNALVRGISRWGNYKHEYYSDKAIISHWMDCYGMVKDEFFEKLNWTINPIPATRWNTDKLLSSGVGEQITERLNNIGARMYHAVPTMIYCNDEESKMNKAERELTPQETNIEFQKNFIEDMNAGNCVDVYMASIWRSGHVIDAIRSIIDQREVRTLTLSANNFTEEQYNRLKRNIKSDKLIVKRTKNEKCSNEKLRFVTEGSSKYVAFCDDDLIYPSGYFKYMVTKCCGLNGCVSYHGGNFKIRNKINSYYGDRRIFGFATKLAADTQVDIIGNGVSLMRRDVFTDTEWQDLYNLATNVSMDDIYVSTKLNQKGIKRFVVSHNANEVTVKKFDKNDNNVFNRYNGDDSVQTDFINSYYFGSLKYVRRDVIISMTSWKDRIGNLPKVLDSILSQTMKADKIIINLSSTEFPGKEDDINPEVLEYIQKNKPIEINWIDGPNTKQWKKFIPVMMKYPDDYVICIDDDKIYERNMVESLYKMHMLHPNNPVQGGKVEYKGFKCHSGPCSLVCGRFFHNIDKYLSDEIYSLHSSDIFFTYLATKNGYPYVSTTHDFENGGKKYNEINPMHLEKTDGNKIIIMWKYLTEKFGELPKTTSSRPKIHNTDQLERRKERRQMILEKRLRAMKTGDNSLYNI